MGFFAKILNMLENKDSILQPKVEVHFTSNIFKVMFYNFVNWNLNFC